MSSINAVHRLVWKLLADQKLNVLRPRLERIDLSAGRWTSEKRNEKNKWNLESLV